MSFIDLSPEGRLTLLDIARAAIDGHLDARPLNIDLAEYPDELSRQGASFVTLRDDSKALRGCIGGLEACQPIILDVAEHAVAAASRDHRFLPLSKVEFMHCSIEISILTPRERIVVDSEQALLDNMQPQIDGIIIEDGFRRATFLPKVWKEVADKKEFLQHLKSKAGFQPDEWPATMQCWRYRSIDFSS